MQSFTMEQLLEIQREVQAEIDRRRIEKFLPKAEEFKEKTLEVLHAKGKIKAVVFLRDELGKVGDSLSACKAIVEKWAAEDYIPRCKDDIVRIWFANGEERAIDTMRCRLVAILDLSKVEIEKIVKSWEPEVRALEEKAIADAESCREEVMKLKYSDVAVSISKVNCVAKLREMVPMPIRFGKRIVDGWFAE